MRLNWSCVLLVFASHITAQDVDRIATAHDTTISYLQYIRCKYTTTNQFPPPGRPNVLTGEITRGPGVLLVTAAGQGFQSAFLARPGRFEVYTKYRRHSDGKIESKSIVTPTYKIRSDTEPLRDVLIVFNVESVLSGRGGLRDYITSKCTGEVITRGDEVFLPYAGSQGGLRLSRQHNYLIIGSESSKQVGGINNSTSMLVTEFSPLANGLQIPTAGERKVTENGKVIMSHHSKLSGLDTSQFNESEVRIRYAGRTEVTNQIDGTMYTVDDAGVQIEKATPFTPLVVGGGLNPRESKTPTTNEPPRTGWWLVPAGGSLVALAAALAMYSRNKRSV
ncbi:MAG: hypothetical protein U0871_24330 [Gemmataceae bacterium]